MTMETTEGLEVEEEVSLDASAETETPDEEQIDPVTAAIASLRADIDKEYGHLRGFDPNSVKAPLGRIPAIQSAIDDLKKNTPTAEMIERLDLSDKALGTLANLMVSDAEQSEAVKAPFRDYISGLDKARTQRDRRALRDELLADIQPVTASTEPAANQWDDASAEVRDEATKNGIDPNAIPWDQIESQANGSPLRATRLAISWIAENKPTTDTSARIAERRRSAGSGSPSREGATNTIERDLERLTTTGIPIEDEAARKRVAAALGLNI